MNLAFLAAFVDAVELPDHDLVRNFVQGFPLVGDIPDSGLFRPVHAPATVPTSTFTPAANRAWRKSVADQVAATAADSRNLPVVQELDRLSRKEVEDGLAFGPFSATEMHREFG